MAYEAPKSHGQRRTAVLFVGMSVTMIAVNTRFWDMVVEAKATAINK